MQKNTWLSSKHRPDFLWDAWCPVVRQVVCLSCLLNMTAWETFLIPRGVTLSCCLSLVAWLSYWLWEVGASPFSLPTCWRMVYPSKKHNLHYPSWKVGLLKLTVSTGWSCWYFLCLLYELILTIVRIAAVFSECSLCMYWRKYFTHMVQFSLFWVLEPSSVIIQSL